MVACNSAFRAIWLAHPWILQPNFHFIGCIADADLEGRAGQRQA